MGARERIQRWLRAFGIRTSPRLDEELTGLERVFSAPPLTDELVGSIRLISPHLDLTTSEESRALWEADQNGACWGEYQALSPLFRSMPRPARILEIGPGLGRSLVFFSKKLGWEDSDIHAYEGEGDTTKYTVLGPRFEDSFCGNISMLRYMLEYNGIRNVAIFDAGETPLGELPGPYDFLYSFYGIGFHWSLQHFLNDLLRLMHQDSVAVFTVPRKFTPFPELKALSYGTIDWRAAWPKGSSLKMLVIGKKALPNLQIEGEVEDGKSCRT